MERLEDNVYGEVPVAEQGATAQEEAVVLPEGQDLEENRLEEKGSTAMGKFKSVDALYKAYESLQAEFTRRSQRLKQLEREAENRKEAQSDGGRTEKFKKISEERKAQEAEFDDFVASLESRATRPETTETQEEKRGQPSVVENRENEAPSSETLYERASTDENVRLKIIGEYLSSLGKTGAPLMRGGARTLVAPPVKARSVEEAGSMALRFFQKDGTQA